MKKTLLVWDAEGLPTASAGDTVLWSGYAGTDDTEFISIPVLVEERADRLRARYLGWIRELGERRIGDKRLVDHMELRKGFSYWWMTLLAQKFNAAHGSQINNAIKALVLEDLVLESKPDLIVLVSDNRGIASVLRHLCNRLQLGFNFNFTRRPGSRGSDPRRIYKLLPAPLRALVYLAWYLARSLPMLWAKPLAAPAFDGEITFVDMLVHLNSQSFTSGEFKSHYWTTLVDSLGRQGVKTNWLHNHFRHKPVETFSRAGRLIDAFNSSARGLQSHALIERNLRPAIFARALRDYFKVYRAGFRIRELGTGFSPEGSSLDLWPLFEPDWIESVSGPSAFLNCLRVCLYEQTLDQLPRLRLGVYIQENQPWEMALIHAWKAAGHGKLVAIPHTTVRFWDLRYFHDPGCYQPDGNNDLPLPDLVAINGPVAKRAQIEGGYPATRIVEAEALRFFHLLNSDRPANTTKASGAVLQVLVCGDFLASTNSKLLSWLATAAESLPPETVYLLKPHPAYPVKSSDFPALTLRISDAPLAELFADCDVVFTSNITSAAVDAYCAGLPVIQMLDGESFNMSPLRGLGGVVYVTGPTQLTEALVRARSREPRQIEPYFFIDEQLPRWRKLLATVQVE